MPTYSFYCKRCDANFENVSTYDERKPHMVCPQCERKKCPFTMDTSKSRYKSGVLVQGTDTPKFFHTGESRAKSEHRWMENQIDATKEALEFKKGARPYTKYELNNEALERDGIAKKVTGDEAKERKKTTHERNLKAAEIADKQMTKLDKDHVTGQQGTKE